MGMRIVCPSVEVGSERLTVGVVGLVRWPICMVVGSDELLGSNVVRSAVMTTGSAKLCLATYVAVASSSSVVSESRLACRWLMKSSKNTDLGSVLCIVDKNCWAVGMVHLLQWMQGSLMLRNV